MKNIKYVFLGNSQNMKEIGEVPNKVDKETAKDSREIFQKYCESSSKQYDKREKIIGGEEKGNYYFTITPNDIFYLILAVNDYPERQIFQLITDIHKDSIYLCVDEKGALNKGGKQLLKNVVESYQNSSNDKLGEVQNNLNEIKIEMNQNMKKVMNNVEDVQDLKMKSDKIKDNSKEFNKKASDLKKLTCWNNYKWGIILTVLLVIIILVIVVGFALKKDSDDDRSDHGKSTNSTLLFF